MNDDDLCTLLGPKVDVGEAKKRIHAATKRLGLRPPYGHEQVLAVFEELASGQGLVAVIARFAKARLLLKS